MEEDVHGLVLKRNDNCTNSVDSTKYTPIEAC